MPLDRDESAMTTRFHVHEVALNRSPERVFRLLITPSDVRGWWGAARCIVEPVEGGTWAAAWGEDENNPDYLTVAQMIVFDPPRRIVLGDYRYRARSGPLPFEADLRTEFTITPTAGGCILRVEQHGFPAGPEADEFYRACEKGWRDTFEAIARHLASSGPAGR